MAGFHQLKSMKIYRTGSHVPEVQRQNAVGNRTLGHPIYDFAIGVDGDFPADNGEIRFRGDLELPLSPAADGDAVAVAAP